jgi:hypothetical protein
MGKGIMSTGFRGIGADLYVGSGKAATLVSGALPAQRCHVANDGVGSL